MGALFPEASTDIGYQGPHVEINKFGPTYHESSLRE
jgi:hypothetical protein